ncbi:MAG: hypothetical protein GF335_01850 [Candidatus Moranbacteria bacterium]|nr:hypothetical protein [Candidatus Moranbacteria bacterium]
MMNKKILILLLFYTIIFTFPVFFLLFNHIPGLHSDTFQVWGKTLEFRNRISDIGIFKTVYWQIKHFKFTPVELTAWVQWITNPFVGYNLMWLFSFFMAAFGMYKLAYYVIKNRYAAFLSSIIFSFAPFHFAQAISTNIGTMHYEFIPFFILYLLKFLKNLKIKDFLLFCFFLVLIAFMEHQLLAFTLVFTILLVFFYLVKNSEMLLKLRFWAFGAAGIIVLLISVKLIFGGLFKVTQQQDNYLDPGKDQVLRYSTDLIEFFTPSRLHPFWGEKFNYLRKNTTANPSGRQANYIGYSVLLLSMISLLGIKKRGLIKLFFFASAILFVILSLGPILHYKGQEITDIWMPYNILYDHLPYWYIIRTVNRIFLIAILCFAISAGFGLDFILRKIQQKYGVQKIKKPEKIKLEFIKNKKITEKINSIFTLFYINFKKKNFLITLLFVLILSMEYLSIPVPTKSMKYSKFYDNLKQEHGNFKIVDIPGATSYDYGSKLMFYNNIHQKNNLAGIDFARVIEDKWDFQENTPILYDLLYSLPTGGKPPEKTIINDYYYNLATKIFNHYNIRYVVISKIYRERDKKFDGQAYENTINFVSGQFNSEKVYEDKYLIAYKIKQSDHIDGWFLAMDLKGDFWSSKEGTGDSVARWAKDGAKMRVVNMGNLPKDIRIFFDTRIKSFKRVEVYLNGKLQESFRIKKEKEEQKVLLENVKPGENELIFRIFDQDNNPVETYELKKGVRISKVRSMEG